MSSITFSPIATRFAWKEFRTLRGFWIAALILAALIQWFLLAAYDRPPAIGWPAALFTVALIAAAFYVVGVAATTFSMEHEEGTYSFLTGLPTRWLPIFAGKLLFALTSALSLAVALTVLACILNGGELPNRANTMFTFGAFGFIIVEALVWGTFFSLLLRQPLLAALLAIGAVSLSLSWLTTTFVEGNLSSLTASSYLAVLPQRAALVFVVFLIDILLARRWLVVSAPHSVTRIASSDQLSSISGKRSLLVRFASWPFAALARHTSARIFGHLCWQTWRQTWQLMFVLPTFAALLCLMFYAFANGENFFVSESQIPLIPFVAGLLATALHASVVYCPDQRGRSYRYLAAHAAWPRYIWFARLAIWLLPIVAILAIVVAFSASGVFDLQREWRQQLNWMLRNNWSNGRYIREQLLDVAILRRGFLFGIWGVFTGFAVGQACSLCFRQALVAGFAAMVVSLPLCALGLAIWAWELPAAVFLFPLVVGLFAATWLRMPDWIVDRHTPRAWLKVAAAVMIPILFIVWQLPAARELVHGKDQLALAQIANGWAARTSLNRNGMSDDVSAVIANWLARDISEVTAANRAAGDRLIRLAEMIEWLPRPNGSDEQSDAKLSRGEQYFQQDVDLNRKRLDEAVTLTSQAPGFPPLFEFDAKGENPIFKHLSSLAVMLSNAGVVATEQGKLDDALKYHLAALQLWQRIADRAPTRILPFRELRGLQSRLVDWAAAAGQTSARIRQAIDAMEAFDFIGTSPRVAWSPPGPLLSDYLEVRENLLGEQPASMLAGGASFTKYLPLLAHHLPFERARALKLLDYLLFVRTTQWYDVVARINQVRLQRRAHESIAQRGRDTTSDDGNAIREQIQLAYESSFDYRHYIPSDDYPPYSWLRTTYLLRDEMERLGSFGQWLQSFVNAQVALWGLRQQLALVAYRIDHGQYPESLDALVPDYLPFVPIDPYSSRQFEYQPKGLPLELRGIFGSESSIAADTPFLWSVGALNAHLEKRTIVETINANVDPSAEIPEIRHDVYEVTMMAVTSWGYLGDSLVFPLPK